MGTVSTRVASTWSGWNVSLPKLLNDCFVGSRLTAMGTKRVPMNVWFRANAIDDLALGRHLSYPSFAIPKTKWQGHRVSPVPSNRTTVSDLLAYLAGASVVVLASAALAWCFTFLASGLAAVPASVAAAVGAAAGAAAVVIAGTALAGVAGACANEATAIPDKREAAIRILIFNMD